MRQLRCRNCGVEFELPDFHGPKLVTCSNCTWQEVFPPRRHLPSKAGRQAGKAYETHEEKMALAAKAMRKLSELPREEFRAFCGNVFAQSGYEVSIPPAKHAAGYDMVLGFNDQATLASCLSLPKGRMIEVAELEALIAAMQDQQVERGVFATTNSYAANCAAFADSAGIELIDGQELIKRLQRLPIADLKSILD